MIQSNMVTGATCTPRGSVRGVCLESPRTQGGGDTDAESQETMGHRTRFTHAPWGLGYLDQFGIPPGS